MSSLKLNKKDGKLTCVNWENWPATKDAEMLFKKELSHLSKLPIHQDIFKQATPFQVKVWKACAKIPAGKTMSYKELAKAIGHPKASRAVGSALGKNPLLYKIPCHRVLTSNGKLGGYSCKFGLKGKKLLLDIERP